MRRYWLAAVCLLIISFTILFSFRQPSPLYAREASREDEAIYVAKKAFDDGFYEVSLGLLERFLKNYPASAKAAQANLLIGRCYFHQNRFIDALTKFEELLHQAAFIKDIHDAVLYWIGEVHFKGNNFTKAGQYYKMIIEQFPNSSYSVPAYYSLGWCFFQEGRFSEALEYFKATEEKSPPGTQSLDSAFKIIECLYNLRDYPGLKDKARLSLKLFSQDALRLPYLYFYMAEADYYLDNFMEAINEYSQVLAKTNDDKIQAVSRVGIGWSWIKLKQYQNAKSTFAEIKAGILEKKSRDIFLLGTAILNSETNNFSAAKDIYNELINAAPEQQVLIQAYLGKADTLYNLAEYKEAIGVYKEALGKAGAGSVRPEFVDKLHYGLAWAFLKEGAFKEAIDEFQKVARNTEDRIVKIAALCQIGDAYQDSGDYRKAQEVYDSILNDYPDSLYSDYVQYQLGLSLLKANNYNGAVMLFLNFKSNFANSKLLDDAYYALGLAYFQKEDYNASKEVFRQFQEEFKDSELKPQALYLLGTSLYNLESFSEAIEVFNNVVKMYGQDTELVQKAEYEIADCFYRMGNEKEAMARFKALRAKYPTSSLTPEVMWWLGEYYYRHDDLDLARRYFSALIQDFPKSNLVSDAYYVLGAIYEEGSKHEEALGNFKKVIELSKSDLAGQAAIAVADIYVKQEKLDMAIKAYQDTAQGYTNLSHLIYPKLGGIYHKLGNQAMAIESYRKSLDMVPISQVADIQFKIAEVFQAQGKREEAIEEYLKVSYLYSEDSNLAVKALLRVAAIYEGQNKYQEAFNIYAKIVSLGADEAKYAQERIDWIKDNKR